STAPRASASSRRSRRGVWSITFILIILLAHCARATRTGSQTLGVSRVCDRDGAGRRAPEAPRLHPLHLTIVSFQVFPFLRRGTRHALCGVGRSSRWGTRSE